MIIPSILSADFAHLAREVHDVEQAGIKEIHVDIMDGHFVPNLSMGTNVIKALKNETQAALDVHLMVEEPDSMLRDFIDAGADRVTVHFEACRHLHRTVQMIKASGVKAGVALNPATPADFLKSILPDLDLVLIMTVNPGFGGQQFIESSLEKISEVRDLIDFRNLKTEIEVDGGINSQTLPLCYQAGATRFVAGSSVFGQSDRTAAINALRQSII